VGWQCWQRLQGMHNQAVSSSIKQYQAVNSEGDLFDCSTPGFSAAPFQISCVHWWLFIRSPVLADPQQSQQYFPEWPGWLPRFTSRFSGHLMHEILRNKEKTNG